MSIGKNRILMVVVFVALLQMKGIDAANENRINLDAVAQHAQQMHVLMEQRKAQGFNVSKAEELDRLSREAAGKGNYDESFRLILEAKSLLEKMKDLPTNQITVALPLSATKVRVTSAVPDFTTGKDVKDSRKAFTPRPVDVKDGKVTLTLTNKPVFVEDISDVSEKTTDTGETSPFGIHEPPVDTYDTRLDDLGIHWIRLSGPSGVVWDADEPEKGKYNWSRIDNCVSLFHKHNVNTVVTVLCFNKWDQGIRTLKVPGIPVTKLPKHLMEYQSFLKRVVERFDGDGIDDAPGSPVIRYWQIENEPDGIGWRDTPNNFAKLVKISYKVIKETNPNAKVLLAGIATPDGFYRFYVPMLEALAKMKESPEERVFDVVDIHWSLEAGGDYRAVKGHNMKTLVSDIRNKLDSLGYKNIPIWITEMSTYCGKPSNPLPGVFLKEKSEVDHAAELVKSYVYPLSLGVKKIFWTYGLVDRHNLGGQGVNNYFDTVGLIHNPLNEGKSHKKLAYYSYKLMVDKLTGSSNIIPLNLGEGIYAYKFLKDGKSVCVLWYERN
ncbi:MAG: hypothetical protein A2W17_02880 [Planctomycetes bacterium RBG_16_41_13]|nr:MAG: hypothetical protein A2W17_02880 [Planctomycetes bacterium RBG_16_41_13]